MTVLTPEMLRKMDEADELTEARTKALGLSRKWAQEFLPKILPPGWAVVTRDDTAAAYDSTAGLRVILSGAVERDNKRWLHLSVSRRHRLPSWEDLKDVKDIFIGVEKLALQVLPPASQYVNLHQNTLHLFHCLDGDVTPDFRPVEGMI